MTEYRAIIDAGLDLQVDDAFIPYQYEKMVPPMTLADYRNWASLRIDALNHALRGCRRTAPLPHLLGQLERTAHVRRADQGHRRSRAEGRCRRL